MEIKKGIAASPGITIAEAMILDSEDYRIPRRSIEDSQRMDEVSRVRNAFKEAIRELSELEAPKQEAKAGKIKDIFAVHLRFLHDRSLRKEVTDLVYSQSVSAEYAVSTVFRKIANHFTNNVKDTYISERAADIYDIERRLLRLLLGHRREDVNHLRKEVVIVTRELSPTQTAGFDRKYIRGIATDAGGRTSHSAIVARSLGIPAVVALEDFTESVRSGDMVIIDGNQGIVIVDPNEATLSEYRQSLLKFTAFEEKLDTIREKEPITRDGVRIYLLGNIEFPNESNVVLEKGGDGIGLYRTEFMYLNRSADSDPTEQEHYEAYAQTIKAFQGRPVVIRTVDLGADKHTQNQRFVKEPNPFLGLRSIRYCLENIRMFKIQLRAILRASALGHVKIMFPLITNLQELHQAKLVLRDVMEDLEEESIAYDKNLEVGIMIETPAAALSAVSLGRESAFFSIGTNDLTQYTLAVDRGNELVSTLYSPVEPAVIRLIRMVIQDGHRHHIDVSICGEMASEPEYVMLLLGLGIRTLSMTPPMIPEIKQLIRSVSMEECNRVARKVLSINTERQITSFQRSTARKVISEAF